MSTVLYIASSILISNNTMSWRDAVEFCAKENRILRQERLGFDEQQFGLFWTQVYEMERFVTLIGEIIS